MVESVEGLWNFEIYILSEIFDQLICIKEGAVV